MKITGSDTNKITGSDTNGVSPERPTGDGAARTKHLHELRGGDLFKARVLDIQPGQVTLQLGGGQVLTARSLVLPDARIGEDTVFLVKEAVQGQILLEMVKEEGAVLQSSFLREALQAAGMTATEENMALARGMMRQALPLDSATLQKAAFFRYAAEGMDVDKALFLLKEGFPPQMKSVTMLTNVLDGTANLAESLGALAAALFLPEAGPLLQNGPGIAAPLADRLLEALLRPFWPGEQQEAASLSLPGALAKDTPGDAAAFMKDAAGNMAVFISELRTRPPKEAARLLLTRVLCPLADGTGREISAYGPRLYEAVAGMRDILKEEVQDSSAKEVLSAPLRRATDILEFMGQIGVEKQYWQIPFAWAGGAAQGELYVFSNAGERKARPGGSISALVALDTAALGRVECFIEKIGKNLRFVCKSDQAATLQLLAANAPALADALRQKGFTVAGVQYQKLEAPYRLTAPLAEKNPEEAVKRYSFDMRV